MNEERTNDAQGTDGFERLGQQARLDFRMSKDGRYDAFQEATLVNDIKDYRVGHHGANGKPLSMRALSEHVGLSEATLSEWLSGRYKGDRQRVCRLADEFLAKERSREGRFKPKFVTITLTKKIVGVFMAIVRNCSMGAVIGEPGDGKTLVARAFAKEREGAFYLCIAEGEGDRRALAASLAKLFGVINAKTFPARAPAIRAYIERHRNTTILIDECQRLTADGIEFLRSIHDLSDLDGHRNTPIILLGDAEFYRLISKARNGEPSPIRPQLVRRLFPILDIERDCCDGGGERLFSEEDIARVLGNGRIRIVSDDGVKWLASVANTRSQGSLGTAMVLVRLSLDIASKLPVGVDELNAALKMMRGPRGAAELNEATGGQLLKRTA